MEPRRLFLKSISRSRIRLVVDGAVTEKIIIEINEFALTDECATASTRRRKRIRRFRLGDQAIARQ